MMISEDTQVTLLLTATLGKEPPTVNPLTLPQFNVFEEKLYSTDHQLSALLLNDSLVDDVCNLCKGDKRVRTPIDPERVRLLLKRGFTLSLACERWSKFGISVVGRTDNIYPIRMKQYLGQKSPSILFYAGNPDLFVGGGLAFVGSRNATDETLVVVENISKECAKLNKIVVSGGARGVDITSMKTSLLNGGKVIGALGCDLIKTTLVPLFRDSIANGNVLLFSHVDPDIQFQGRFAMERNKYIYAMSDCCFVAQSGTEGGTWAGATEELKNPDHHQVYSYISNPPFEGNLELIKMGAIPWENDRPLCEKLNDILNKNNTIVNDTDKKNTKKMTRQYSLLDF